MSNPNGDSRKCNSDEARGGRGRKDIAWITAEVEEGGGRGRLKGL